MRHRGGVYCKLNINFSLCDNLYYENKKIYSSEDGERLFTVSMSKEELNLYSIFSPVEIQSDSVSTSDMLLNNLKHPLKGVRYIKPDGSTDKKAQFKAAILSNIY